MSNMVDASSPTTTASFVRPSLLDTPSCVSEESNMKTCNLTISWDDGTATSLQVGVDAAHLKPWQQADDIILTQKGLRKPLLVVVSINGPEPDRQVYTRFYNDHQGVNYALAADDAVGY